MIVDEARGMESYSIEAELELGTTVGIAVVAMARECLGNSGWTTHPFCSEAGSRYLRSP